MWPLYSFTSSLIECAGACKLDFNRDDVTTPGQKRCNGFAYESQSGVCHFLDLTVAADDVGSVNASQFGGAKVYKIAPGTIDAKLNLWISLAFF